MNDAQSYPVTAGALLPCPFCDEQPSFTDVELMDERRYAQKLLRCCSIEMSASLSFGQYKGLTDAQIDHTLRSELVRSWNQRAPQPSGAAQRPTNPAFEAMISNLIDLDKQRSPGPWRKTHDNVTANHRVPRTPKGTTDVSLVARCDADWSSFMVDMTKASKNARFIVALENAWPKILEALAVTSTNR